MGRHASTDRRPDCPDCVSRNQGRQRSLRRLRCVPHTCPVIVENNQPCGEHKSRLVADCGKHHRQQPAVRLCELEACILMPSKTSPYCVLHACAFAGCQDYSNAVDGKDYCDIHRCTAPSCQALRKRNPVEDRLELASFCRPHECNTKNCPAQKVPRKNHCETHCCTFANCPAARHPQLDTYCKDHYSEQLRADATARYDSELQAKAEAVKRAQEHERLEKRTRELEREKEQREADEKDVRNYNAKVKVAAERKLREEQEARDEKLARELEQADLREQFYHNKKRETGEERARNDKEYEAPQQQNKSAHFTRKLPKVFVNHNSGYGDDHLNVPSSSRAWEPSTTIPHRSIPRGGTRNFESGKYTSGPEKWYSSDHDKRSSTGSTGSYVNVDRIDPDWDNDSAYDHDHVEETSRPKPRPGWSNQGTSGASTGRSVSPDLEPGIREHNTRNRHEDETTRGGTHDIYGRPIYSRDNVTRQERERDQVRETEDERDQRERLRARQGGRGEGREREGGESSRRDNGRRYDDNGKGKGREDDMGGRYQR